MKTMPISHMAAWCEKQGFNLDILNAMLDKANSDIEYWHDTDYWRLYDAIK